MSRPIIDEDACVACGVCVDACPCEVLELGSTVVEVVDEDSCVACEACLEECPVGAITEIADE